MLRLGLSTIVLASAISMANAARCADYSSCEQAVRAWCAGYHPRADGDNDGIPCENLCPNKRVVDQIRQEIGC